MTGDKTVALFMKHLLPLQTVSNAACAHLSESFGEGTHFRSFYQKTTDSGEAGPATICGRHRRFENGDDGHIIFKCSGIVVHWSSREFNCTVKQ